MSNPLFDIDFYKADHRPQYPEGTEYVYSNFTPRSARLANMLDDFDNKVVVVAIQSYVKKVLIDKWNKYFFHRDKNEVMEEYERRMDLSLGEGAIDCTHISDLHDLGYLPLLIKALPEGSRVNIGVPVLTVINTDPKFFWLTNYIETSMSAELWKPMTTATIAYEYRRLLDRYAEETGAPMDFVPLQGHDFSSRGMSGNEDAMMSGVGHLTSFIGTDNVAAIEYAEKYYGDGVVGVSVPATEHSVMCMGGQEDEVGTFKRLITEIYPKGIVSIVSDTWDFWKVITEYSVTLKEEILNRETNALGLAKTVFRPDSGDPVKILCGDPDAEPGSPQFKGAVECLWDIFGGTKSEKGFKFLHERVGLIYGDSITLGRAEAICSRLKAKGFGSTNVVFGIGSYTYQYITRDTFGFAMKATWGQVNGVGREIMKDPITDNGNKKSAKGLLCVHKTEEGYKLEDRCDLHQEIWGELRDVFIDGMVGARTSFNTVKERLNT